MQNLETPNSITTIVFEKHLLIHFYEVESIELTLFSLFKDDSGVVLSKHLFELI